MCFLGGPVLFDMFVCIVHAWTIIFDTFWQCGIESMCLAKSCDPNYPQNARKNPANARKNCQTRANPDFWSFRVIWVVLQRTHFWPCLKDNEFNRSHAHSVCLGLPIKLATQDWTTILDWWFPDGAIMMPTTCFSKDRLVFILWLQIAAFFYETPHYLKRLEFSMQWKLEDINGFMVNPPSLGISDHGHVNPHYIMDWWPSPNLYI